MQNLRENKNIIVFLSLLLAIVLLVWFFVPSLLLYSPSYEDVMIIDGKVVKRPPMMNKMSEMMPSMMGGSEHKQEQEMKPAEHFDANAVGNAIQSSVSAAQQKISDMTAKPSIDPRTGMVVDGPGSEQGPVEGIPQDSTFDKIPSNYYFLDDGAGGEMSIQHNLCSKSCCSDQWPTPFKQKYDPYVCGNKDKFVPSKIYCNNTFQDSGCLCLTNKQANFLYNRGSNGREWF